MKYTSDGESLSNENGDDVLYGLSTVVGAAAPEASEWCDLEPPAVPMVPDSDRLKLRKNSPMMYSMPATKRPIAPN